MSLIESTPECAMQLCKELQDAGLEVSVKRTFVHLNLRRALGSAVRSASDSSVRYSISERASRAGSRSHSRQSSWADSADDRLASDEWSRCYEAADKLSCGSQRTSETASTNDDLECDEEIIVLDDDEDDSLSEQRAGGATPPAEEPKRRRDRRGKPRRSIDNANLQLVDPEDRTTLMFKNIPSGYLRRELQQLLDEAGFEGEYDFVHAPVDCFSGSGLGYAFCNMTRGVVAARAFQVLQGFSEWSVQSQKVLSVCWGDEQGLEPLVARYRNSRMMHPSVPEGYRPLLLENGAPVEFPAPTRRVLKPRCMPNRDGRGPVSQ